ncbi:hypothetical protein NPS70_05965 [Streptomyces sp. C10-9-1]|uniref:hypothetical protein n=1 Tax=Streptomyces sp. C10-9-1 TaxID=1859285 RepID=UPI0021132A21|nr:hypothetical protein [Streptomyces sp. C10-9-1]MCQ6552745.1 hypothetical protein [Streptomyces sp. C10-9-1]
MATGDTTDARRWEYTTYAPKGERCSACLRPIRSLERVHRAATPGPPGPAAAVYRHTACPAEDG